MGTLRVLGVAGSLRRASLNRALLRAAVERAPEAGLEVTPFDIAAIPLYNGDVEEKGIPDPVAAFKQAIAEADGLLIATPEYNYGVPGVLKNAVDWASRPPGESPLVGKPAAIMGATPGASGTVRAQLQLRLSFVFTQTLVMPQPEVAVHRAHEKFDATGRLTDEPTRKFLDQMLHAFAAWIRRFRPGA